MYYHNKETYTAEDFQFNSYAWKVMEADGSIDRYTGKYSLNYSHILSRLIQEAGRYCENFASDLFIDWQAVERFLNETNGAAEKVFLFGFRASGVDHDSFIFSRFENEKSYAAHSYRSLWRLVVSMNGEKCFMLCGRVF